MSEIETITWRELTGNKFIVSLHSAMYSDTGYVKQQGIRKIGDVQKTLFNVTYDSDYLVEYLARKVCRNLFSLGKEKTLELVSNAWDLAYPNQVNNQGKSSNTSS